MLVVLPLVFLNLDYCHMETSHFKIRHILHIWGDTIQTRDCDLITNTLTTLAI
jgi:hypothetical protein